MRHASQLPQRDRIRAAVLASEPAKPRFHVESIAEWTARTGNVPEVLASAEVPRVGYPRGNLQHHARAGQS